MSSKDEFYYISQSGLVNRHSFIQLEKLCEEFEKKWIYCPLINQVIATNSLLGSVLEIINRKITPLKSRNIQWQEAIVKKITSENKKDSLTSTLCFQNYLEEKNAKVEIPSPPIQGYHIDLDNEHSFSKYSLFSRQTTPFQKKILFNELKKIDTFTQNDDFYSDFSLFWKHLGQELSKQDSNLAKLIFLPLLSQQFNQPSSFFNLLESKKDEIKTHEEQLRIYRKPFIELLKTKGTIEDHQRELEKLSQKISIDIHQLNVNQEIFLYIDCPLIPNELIRFITQSLISPDYLLQWLQDRLTQNFYKNIEEILKKAPLTLIQKLSRTSNLSINNHIITDTLLNLLKNGVRSPLKHISDQSPALEFCIELLPQVIKDGLDSLTYSKIISLDDLNLLQKICEETSLKGIESALKKFILPKLIENFKDRLLSPILSQLEHNQKNLQSILQETDLDSKIGKVWCHIKKTNETHYSLDLYTSNTINGTSILSFQNIPKSTFSKEFIFLFLRFEALPQWDPSISFSSQNFQDYFVNRLAPYQISQQSQEIPLKNTASLLLFLSTQQILSEEFLNEFQLQMLFYSLISFIKNEHFLDVMLDKSKADKCFSWIQKIETKLILLSKNQKLSEREFKKLWGTLLQAKSKLLSFYKKSPPPPSFSSKIPWIYQKLIEQATQLFNISTKDLVFIKEVFLDLLEDSSLVEFLTTEYLSFLKQRELDSSQSHTSFSLLNPPSFEDLTYLVIKELLENKFWIAATACNITFNYLFYTKSISISSIPYYILETLLIKFGPKILSLILPKEIFELYQNTHKEFSKIIAKTSLELLFKIFLDKKTVQEWFQKNISIEKLIPQNKIDLSPLIDFLDLQTIPSQYLEPLDQKIDSIKEEKNVEDMITDLSHLAQYPPVFISNEEHSLFSLKLNEVLSSSLLKALPSSFGKKKESIIKKTIEHLKTTYLSTDSERQSQQSKKKTKPFSDNVVSILKAYQKISKMRPLDKISLMLKGYQSKCLLLNNTPPLLQELEIILLETENLLLQIEPSKAQQQKHSYQYLRQLESIFDLLTILHTKKTEFKYDEIAHSRILGSLYYVLVLMDATCRDQLSPQVVMPHLELKELSQSLKTSPYTSKLLEKSLTYFNQQNKDDQKGLFFYLSPTHDFNWEDFIDSSELTFYTHLYEQNPFFQKRADNFLQHKFSQQRTSQHLDLRLTRTLTSSLVFKTSLSEDQKLLLLSVFQKGFLIYPLEALRKCVINAYLIFLSPNSTIPYKESPFSHFKHSLPRKNISIEIPKSIIDIKKTIPQYPLKSLSLSITTPHECDNCLLWLIESFDYLVEEEQSIEILSYLERKFRYQETPPHLYKDYTTELKSLFIKSCNYTLRLDEHHKESLILVLFNLYQTLAISFTPEPDSYIQTYLQFLENEFNDHYLIQEIYDAYTLKLITQQSSCDLKKIHHYFSLSAKNNETIYHFYNLNPETASLEVYSNVHHNKKKTTLFKQHHLIKADIDPNVLSQDVKLNDRMTFINPQTQKTYFLISRHDPDYYEIFFGNFLQTYLEKYNEISFIGTASQNAQENISLHAFDKQGSLLKTIPYLLQNQPKNCIARIPLPQQLQKSLSSSTMFRSQSKISIDYYRDCEPVLNLGNTHFSLRMAKNSLRAYDCIAKDFYLSSQHPRQFIDHGSKLFLENEQGDRKILLFIDSLIQPFLLLVKSCDRYLGKETIELLLLILNQFLPEFNNIEENLSLGFDAPPIRLNVSSQNQLEGETIQEISFLCVFYLLNYQEELAQKNLKLLKEKLPNEDINEQTLFFLFLLSPFLITSTEHNTVLSILEVFSLLTQNHNAAAIIASKGSSTTTKSLSYLAHLIIFIYFQQKPISFSYVSDQIFLNLTLSCQKHFEKLLFNIIDFSDKKHVSYLQKILNAISHNIISSLIKEESLESTILFLIRLSSYYIFSKEHIYRLLLIKNTTKFESQDPLCSLRINDILKNSSSNFIETVFDNLCDFFIQWEPSLKKFVLETIFKLPYLKHHSQKPLILSPINHFLKTIALNYKKSYDLPSINLKTIMPKLYATTLESEISFEEKTTFIKNLKGLHLQQENTYPPVTVFDFSSDQLKSRFFDYLRIVINEFPKFPYKATIFKCIFKEKRNTFLNCLQHTSHHLDPVAKFLIQILITYSQKSFSSFSIDRHIVDPIEKIPVQHTCHELISDTLSSWFEKERVHQMSFYVAQHSLSFLTSTQVSSRIKKTISSSSSYLGPLAQTLALSPFMISPTCAKVMKYSKLALKKHYEIFHPPSIAPQKQQDRLTESKDSTDVVFKEIFSFQNKESLFYKNFISKLKTFKQNSGSPKLLLDLYVDIHKNMMQTSRRNEKLLSQLFQFIENLTIHDQHYSKKFIGKIIPQYSSMRWKLGLLLDIFENGSAQKYQEQLSIVNQEQRTFFDKSLYLYLLSLQSLKKLERILDILHTSIKEKTTPSFHNLVLLVYQNPHKTLLKEKERVIRSSLIMEFKQGYPLTKETQKCIKTLLETNPQKEFDYLSRLLILSSSKMNLQFSYKDQLILDILPYKETCLLRSYCQDEIRSLQLKISHSISNAHPISLSSSTFYELSFTFLALLKKESQTNADKESLYSLSTLLTTIQEKSVILDNLHSLMYSFPKITTFPLSEKSPIPLQDLNNIHIVFCKIKELIPNFHHFLENFILHSESEYESIVRHIGLHILNSNIISSHTNNKESLFKYITQSEEEIPDSLLSHDQKDDILFFKKLLTHSIPKYLKSFYRHHGDKAGIESILEIYFNTLFFPLSSDDIDDFLVRLSQYYKQQTTKEKFHLKQLFSQLWKINIQEIDQKRKLFSQIILGTYSECFETKLQIAFWKLFQKPFESSFTLKLSQYDILNSLGIDFSTTDFDSVFQPKLSIESITKTQIPQSESSLEDIFLKILEHDPNYPIVVFSDTIPCEKLAKECQNIISATTFHHIAFFQNNDKCVILNQSQELIPFESFDWHQKGVMTLLTPSQLLKFKSKKDDVCEIFFISSNYQTLNIPFITTLSSYKSLHLFHHHHPSIPPSFFQLQTDNYDYFLSEQALDFIKSKARQFLIKSIHNHIRQHNYNNAYELMSQFSDFFKLDSLSDMTSNERCLDLKPNFHRNLNRKIKYECIQRLRSTSLIDQNDLESLENFIASSVTHLDYSPKKYYN